MIVMNTSNMQRLILSAADGIVLLTHVGFQNCGGIGALVSRLVLGRVTDRSPFIDCTEERHAPHPD